MVFQEYLPTWNRWLLDLFATSPAALQGSTRQREEKSIVKVAICSAPGKVNVLAWDYSTSSIVTHKRY